MKNHNRKCYRVILRIELYVIDKASIFHMNDDSSFSPTILDYG